MRFIGLLFLLILSISARAQEQERYRQVAEIFMEAYNAENYERIFSMFDSVMQKGLSLERTREFLGKQIRGAVGDIRKMEFYRNQGDAHIYKSTFEGDIMDILIALDPKNRLNGLYLKPHLPVDAQYPIIERNITKMMLPVKGEWFVFWGGESEDLNYHMANVHQQYAYDLLIVQDGASYFGDPSKNESYHAYGQDIIAPCDGTVVLAIDGVPDNKPGDLNPIHVTGNTLVLETEHKEYVLFAHLKSGSIAVQKGQKVEQGEFLALCGNSGNSSEPHLHLQLQNARDFHKATGAKLLFESILVNGEFKSDYLPLKEQFIENHNSVN